MNIKGISRRNTLTGLALIAPVLLYLLLVQAYPFISAIMTSLTDKEIGTTGRFIGFQNYIVLFKDPLFWLAVRNTLTITIGAIIAKLVFGVIMALVLNHELFLKSLWRALLFLPWTIPTIVTVLAFEWMFSSTGGVLNYLLLKSHLISSPIDWLGTPGIAVLSILIVNIWRGTPFFGISILGGLQSISKELYEAAEMDGANVVERFLHVTLPALRDVILLVTVVSTIWTMNDFQIIWVLTRGGPANTTQVLSTLSYTTAFLNLKLGRGIAISVVLLPLLILLVSWATRAVLKRDE